MKVRHFMFCVQIIKKEKKKHSGIYATCTNAVCMTWALTVTVQFLGYIFEWIYNVRGFVKQQLSGVWDFVHAGGNFESHLHKILFSESKTLLWSNITEQLALDSYDWLTDSVVTVCSPCSCLPYPTAKCCVKSRCASCSASINSRLLVDLFKAMPH